MFVCPWLALGISLARVVRACVWLVCVLCVWLLPLGFGDQARVCGPCVVRVLCAPISRSGGGCSICIPGVSRVAINQIEQSVASEASYAAKGN